MNKRYQVFVSSTYADLKEERAKVIQTIMELDCIPAGMEIFPAIDEDQFEFIKKIIDDCDYYLLIIGGRYGSLSNDGISYTEKEYDYAIRKNIKVIAFIHANPDDIPLGKSEKDAELREKLVKFKEKVAAKRLVKLWNNVDELPGLVSLSLSKTIKTYPAIGWIRANTAADSELYKLITELQQENKELKELVQKSASENIDSNDLDNLAALEDSIEISGIHTLRDSKFQRDIKSNWKVPVTWNQIFGLISPYLIDHPNDGLVKSHLSSSIYSLAPDASPRGTATLIDQDFQTIKIQLKALGLINVNYTKTIQGGMGLFWSLTPKGENLMMKLRTVKK